MKTSPTLHRMRQLLNKKYLASALLAAMIAAPAFADDLADVTKLVRGGQYADALGKADAYLSKHPHDAQMRFLKGVILTEQGKNADAITVFTKLTEDFPELPEPYNNLAVLFAASGQYDKARLALDNAIRTNPSYATAYENLGDVHAKLASQAYDKALQLDSSNAAAKSKLTLLRTLASNNAKVQTVAATTPAAAPTPVPATTPAVVAPAAPVTAPVTPTPVPTTPVKPTVVASATPTPAPVTPPPVVQPAVKPAASVKPDVKVEPPKQEPKVEPKPEVKPVAKPDNSDNDDIVAAVNGWAKAWSEQDVKTYLNYYANDFDTPKGESRKDWATERQQRIEGKSHIEVKVESPQVSINGNSATVKFRQIYTSDRLKADSRKVLVLTKQGGKWQIKQERAGS